MHFEGLLNGSGPASEAAQMGEIPQESKNAVTSLEAEETGGLPPMPPAGQEAAAGLSADAPLPLPTQEALNIHQSQEPNGSLYSEHAPQMIGMPGTAGELGVAPEQSEDPVQPFEKEVVQQPPMSADVDQPLPGTATSQDESMSDAPMAQQQQEAAASGLPAFEASSMPQAPEPVTNGLYSSQLPPMPSPAAEQLPSQPTEQQQPPSVPQLEPSPVPQQQSASVQQTEQLAAKTLHQPPAVPESPVLDSAVSEQPLTAASSNADAIATPSVYPPTAESLYPPPPSAASSAPPSAFNDVNMTGLPPSESPADVSMDNGHPTPQFQKRTHDLESSQGPSVKRQKLSPSMSPAPQTAPQIAYPPPQMSKEQQKYCGSVMKALKKSRDAPPFLAPVDPVALGIPHYPNVITHPMDLGTIDYKLSKKMYASVEDFTADMRLMLNNCYKFNGETSPVGLMAKNLEALFNKQLTKMPVYVPPAMSALHVNKPKKQSSSRRQSEGSHRPKREIQAPMTYDALEDQMAAKKRKSLTSQHDTDMRFCSQVLKELMKKSHAEINWIFLQPVDPVALGIPDYFNIVKKPMDLGTMRQKLDQGFYRSSNDFYSDFKQIIHNCQTYNASGSNPYILAAHLDSLFENKWAEKADMSEDSASDSDDQIALMEQQLQMMAQNIENLKAARDKRRTERRAAKQAASKAAKAALRQSNGHLPPLPSLPPLPAPPPKQPKAPRRSSTGQPKRRARQDSDEEFGAPAEEEVTWGMKQELANSMATVSGDRLEKAIDIIRKARPDLLGDGQEIELDIDSLDTATLLKLYNFAVGKPGKPPKGRRESTLTASGHRAHKGGRAGTGGLKGKSLDEDQESAYIATLEARLHAFDSGAAGNGNGAMPSVPGQDADAMGSASSDSDDGSDSDSDF